MDEGQSWLDEGEASERAELVVAGPWQAWHRWHATGEPLGHAARERVFGVHRHGPHVLGFDLGEAGRARLVVWPLDDARTVLSATIWRPWRPAPVLTPWLARALPAMYTAQP